MAVLRPPDPPDPSEARRPDEEMAFSMLSFQDMHSVDQFLSSHGLQFQDPLLGPDDDDFLNLADLETYDPRVHFLPALDPASSTPSIRITDLLTPPPRQLSSAVSTAGYAEYWSPVPVPTADSHPHPVPEPTAALLNSFSKNHELAPVAIDSPHRVYEHSSNSHSLSSSSSAADTNSHSHPVPEPTAALLNSFSKNHELAPVAIDSSYRELDHSSYSNSLSSSSSAADPHSHHVPESTAALLESELAPVAIESALPDASAPPESPMKGKKSRPRRHKDGG